MKSQTKVNVYLRNLKFFMGMKENKVLLSIFIKYRKIKNLLIGDKKILHLESQLINQYTTSILCFSTIQMSKIITIPWTWVISSKEFTKGKTKIESNSYLIKTPKMNILIDTGSKTLFKVLQEQEVNHLDAILLTHGHADHIKRLRRLWKRYKCNIYLHPNDHSLLTDSYLNWSKLVNKTKITAKKCHPVPLRDSELLRFDNLSFQVIHTPGHTHGSVMYYCEQLHALFTGDMILWNTIWSTRVPTGNKDEREKSIEKIKQFLGTLPANTVIYPWHGKRITLEELQKINPRFKKEK